MMLYYPGMEFELPDEAAGAGISTPRYRNSLIEENLRELLQLRVIEKTYEQAGSGDANNED